MEKRGLWHSVQVFLLGVYLAIVTFFKTMFSLEAESQVKRRNSGPRGGPPGPPGPPRGVRGMGNLGGTNPHGEVQGLFSLAPSQSNMILCFANGYFRVAVSKCCGGGCG